MQGLPDPTRPADVDILNGSGAPGRSAPGSRSTKCSPPPWSLRCTAGAHPRGEPCIWAPSAMRLAFRARQLQQYPMVADRAQRRGSKLHLAVEHGDHRVDACRRYRDLPKATPRMRRPAFGNRPGARAHIFKLTVAQVAEHPRPAPHRLLRREIARTLSSTSPGSRHEQTLQPSLSKSKVAVAPA